MNCLIPAILSLICAGPSSAAARESSARVVDDRRSGLPVYAKTFSDEYEPFAVAAIPLNAAMPIFRLVSPGYRTEYKKPVKKRTHHDRNRDTYAYDVSNGDQVYDQYGYDTEEVEIVNPQKYSKTNPYDDDSSDVIVYARPNKHGGYTYRKNPSHFSHSSYSPHSSYSSPVLSHSPYSPHSSYSSPVLSHSSYSPHSSHSSPVPTFTSTETHDQKPVIIRIHKYRVIH